MARGAEEIVVTGPAGEPAEAVLRDVDKPVISFRDVHLSYDRPILKGVSFDLFPGTTKIVLGGSGSGKTTILRIVLGLLKNETTFQAGLKRKRRRCAMDHDYLYQVLTTAKS